MSGADDRPTRNPQPGLLKTTGTFNLIFGGLLLLCGAGCMTGLVPFLLENSPFQLDPTLTRDALDDMRRQLVADLQTREGAAKTAVEKERIRKWRTDLESKRGLVDGQVDFATINRELPWVSRYLWADVVSGPTLNFLMVVSGVGLIRVKGWGRRLAIGVAALKLVRLVALTTVLIGLAIPSLLRAMEQLGRTDVGEAIVRQINEEQNAQMKGTAPGTGPRLTAPDIVKIVRATGYGSAGMLLGCGAIYPVICLVVLTRPGARQACEPDVDAAEGPPPSPPAGP